MDVVYIIEYYYLVERLLLEDSNLDLLNYYLMILFGGVLELVIDFHKNAHRNGIN